MKKLKKPLDKHPFVWYIITMKRENWLNILRQRDRMREMEEMEKAFDDFSKACNEAVGACQDFIEMDINKTTKPTLEERAESPADDARKKLTQRDEVANKTFYYW